MMLGLNLSTLVSLLQEHAPIQKFPWISTLLAIIKEYINSSKICEQGELCYLEPARVIGE